MPEVAASIGARPHEHDAVSGASWHDAARAGGRPVDEMTYRAAADSELHGYRAMWAQIESAAPLYVEDELDRAARARSQAEADRALLEHEAQRTGDEHMAAEAARLADQAAVAAERERALAEIAEVRREWERVHEADRDRAVEAERELKRRGREVRGDELQPDERLLYDAEGRGDDETDREAAEQAERQHDDTERELAAEPQQAERAAEAETVAEAEVEAEPERPATAAERAAEQAIGDRSYDDAHDRGGRDILAPHVARRSVDESAMTVREATEQAERARVQMAERQQAMSGQDATLEAEETERDQRWERDRAAERDRDVTAERERETEVEL